MIKILFTNANAKEVMYFKKIIKGVKSQIFFPAGISWRAAANTANFMYKAARK